MKRGVAGWRVALVVSIVGATVVACGASSPSASPSVPPPTVAPTSSSDVLSDTVDPSAGNPAGNPPGDVATVYLDQVQNLGDPIDAGGIIEINGTPHPHSLGAEYCPPIDNRTWQYNLSRSYQAFRATVGLDDTSDTKGIVRFEVYGDDRILYTKDIGFGTADDVSVSVAGVLRLKLVSTPLAELGCSGTKPRWGEARLEGVPGQIPATN